MRHLSVAAERPEPYPWLSRLRLAARPAAPSRGLRIPALPALRAGAALGYRPRSASNSLKEIVEDSLDELIQSWETRFAKDFGPLHPRVKKLFESFTRCGDLHFGFVRLRCVNPDCDKKDEKLLPYSCRVRGYAEWMNMLSTRASPRARIQFYKALPA